MILDVLVLGLAVFGLTEVVKLFLPFSLLSQVKGVVVVVLAAVGAALLASTIREGVFLGAGTIGAAIVLHGLAKALDAVGEIHRVEAMQRVARMMRP